MGADRILVSMKSGLEDRNNPYDRDNCALMHRDWSQ